MSDYTITQLHEGTRISGKPAWHYSRADLAALEARGFYFPNGPVPADVALELVGWQPVTFTIDTLVDPKTMIAYKVPDYMRQIVARPDHGVVNAVGLGFDADLHNVLRENLETALHGGYTIEACVCLGDGDFLGVTLIPSDDITVKGQFGTLAPKLAMVSSLTGKIKTGLIATTTRGECDNTMRAQLASAVAKLLVKRTRNSATRVTPSHIAATLDIAVRHTQEVADEMERMGQIGISDGDLAAILDAWQPLVKKDGTDKEGRGLTMALNQRGTFVELLTRDPRKGDLGQTAAGLWNAHNMWQHWNMTARGGDNRIARQMERTATGEVGTLDDRFMELVMAQVPAVRKALATV